MSGWTFKLTFDGWVFPLILLAGSATCFFFVLADTNKKQLQLEADHAELELRRQYMDRENATFADGTRCKAVSVCFEPDGGAYTMEYR